jgi:hypothetical protein
LAQGGLSQNTSPFAPQRTFVCKQQTFVWKQQTFVCNSKRSSATANVRLQQQTYVQRFDQSSDVSMRVAVGSTISAGTGVVQLLKPFETLNPFEL